MKKSLLALIILVSVVFAAPAAQTFDTVILLDTSESMFPYFDSSVDYLIQDIIKNQLKVGDTFHLLTFANTPEYEISRKITGKKDIEEILSRILLLQPLGKYTDLITALGYLNTYTNKLSPETFKKVIILTDGIHDPPPGSDSATIDEKTLLDKIKQITGNMKRQGWDVSLIRFPLSAGNDAANTSTGSSGSKGTQTSSGGVDLFTELSTELDTRIIDYDSNNNVLSHKATGEPQIIFPADLGEVSFRFAIPFRVKNFSAEPVQIRLKEIIWDKQNILNKEAFVKVDADSDKTLKAEVSLSKEVTPGNYTIPLELVFADDTRPYPRTGSISFILKEPGVGGSIDWGKVLKILFYVVIILVAVLIIVFIVKYLSGRSYAAAGRRIHHEPEERRTAGYTNRKEEEKEQNRSAKLQEISGVEKGRNERNSSYKYKKEPEKRTHKVSEVDRAAIKHEKKHHAHGPDEKAFEMVVQNQNRLVGMRNIHWFKDGAVYTLGGGASDDYLIFIHPVEKRIAEIERRGSRLVIKVLNGDFFKEIATEREVTEKKDIKLVSSDGKEFTLSFREWISPADRINRILHLIDKPGLPDFRY